ncbi:MAG: MoxR family ATPase [Anaerolineales bacterium]|nr:MoxR family ATPase [Anaerolineales bacterium]
MFTLKTAAPPLTPAPDLAELFARLAASVEAVVVVEPARLRLIIAALLARGHVLLEDVPGVGKTLVAKALARSLAAEFKRVQCTPDLLPSDITGSSLYDQRRQEFTFIPGPLFAHVVLLDEINRATPRTQSSLLEALAEGQVTTDGVTRRLEQPFFVIATQNPVETAGTFPLPEAQLDRFLFSLSLGYPGAEAELRILEQEEHGSPLAGLQPVLALEDVLRLQAAVLAVQVARPLKEYIVRLVLATRGHPDVILGVSPRGGVAVQRAAQAVALLAGRDFVIPDDVKAVAAAAMAHRLITRQRGLAAGQSVVAEVLAQVPVPL